MDSMRFGPDPTHTIAHLSDPHLLADGKRLGGAVAVGEHLRRTVQQLERTGRSVDAMVFTGDLTDLGEPDAYRELREIVLPSADRLGCEVIWVMGNHDERGPYSQHLFDGPDTDDPQDRVYDLQGLRVIALDSTVTGYHHGGLDEEQLRWLADELATPAEHGTLLAMHHPPIPSVVDLMNLLGLDNRDAFAEVIAGSDVRGVLAGHFHYSCHGTFAGVPVSVSAASCYSLDAGAPNRSLVGVDGRQGFDLVDIYPDSLLHTQIPLGSPPVVSGFDDAVADALEALPERERREAFSSKSSTWTPPAY
ncbi:metallophosphoesterase [Yimella sp. cx-573]|nr:metallophosphoesterase [Yimella sp. cx-573]